MPMPPIRYAIAADGAHIAYQTLGDGPVDLVVVHGFVSHVEMLWEWPRFEQFMRGLARHARVTHFDKRGMGLSDRLVRLPTFEARMDDIVGVLDALDAERAVLMAYGDGNALATLFAATHPERTAGLILEGSFGLSVSENIVASWDDNARMWRGLMEGWTGASEAAAQLAGAIIGHDSRLVLDPSVVAGIARVMRNASAPGDLLALQEIWYHTDASTAATLVQAPCVVYYREGWARRQYPDLLAVSQQMARQIPGAELVVVEGEELFPFLDKVDALVERIGRFLTSVRAEEQGFARVLATVLFTDIVSSTERMATAGDAGWKSLAERHHAHVRTLLHRYRGSEVDTAGDGFFATFDGPSRGVRCAHAIVRTMHEAGIDVRAGLHTGEVEVVNGKAGGIAVVVGARIGGLAVAGEVLVSRTVRDLAAGSGLAFVPRGRRRLRGVPGMWDVYRVAPPTH
jgi:class 3 adenylate cyclase